MMSSEPVMMTMMQAERWLGLKPTVEGRGLLRTLERREKQSGARIILRGSGKRVTYRVTRSALRRHCKDLVPSKTDELRSRFGEFLKSIDERIESRTAECVAELVEPQLDELYEQDEVNAEAIKQLSVRVHRLADEMKRIRSNPT